MLLILLIILIVGIAVLVFRHQKRFLKKDIKETIKNEDLKAYLNLPHKKAHFNKDLDKIRQKEDASQKILKDLNSNN